MKIAIFAVAALALVGGVMDVDVAEPVAASHTGCEGSDDPCDPDFRPWPPGSFLCAYLEHYNLC